MLHPWRRLPLVLADLGAAAVNPAGLTIFVFMNRETNTRTDEIYVFPGEATFEKCKSAGDSRVYLLKVANRREFFWMQDKDDSKVGAAAAFLACAPACTPRQLCVVPISQPPCPPLSVARWLRLVPTWA